MEEVYDVATNVAEEVADEVVDTVVDTAVDVPAVVKTGYSVKSFIGGVAVGVGLTIASKVIKKGVINGAKAIKGLFGKKKDEAEDHIGLNTDNQDADSFEEEAK